MEKICRIISSEFPSVSSSKIDAFQHANEYRIYQAFLQERLEMNIRAPLFAINEINEVTRYVKTLLECIKRYKVANCSELSKIVEIICRINNIEISSGRLYGINDKNRLEKTIYHAFCVIKTDNNKKKYNNKILAPQKSLVIDPWLGFVDYADNAVLKYKSIYAKYLGIEQMKDLLLVTNSSFIPKLDIKTKQNLAKKYPQLILGNL